MRGRAVFQEVDALFKFHSKEEIPVGHLKSQYNQGIKEIKIKMHAWIVRLNLLRGVNENTDHQRKKDEQTQKDFLKRRCKEMVKSQTDKETTKKE